MAERLRRLTWNQMGSSHVSSNPAGDIIFMGTFRHFYSISLFFKYVIRNQWNVPMFKKYFLDWICPLIPRKPLLLRIAYLRWSVRTFLFWYFQITACIKKILKQRKFLRQINYQTEKPKYMSIIDMSYKRKKADWYVFLNNV